MYRIIQHISRPLTPRDIDRLAADPDEECDHDKSHTTVPRLQKIFALPTP
jgi:hypothetical protein